MSLELEYTIEIDFRGKPDSMGNRQHENLSNSTYGITNGIMRLITGDTEQSFLGDLFSAKMLTREGIPKAFKRVDISETGNYATFSRMQIKIDNTSGFSDFISTNKIYFKNSIIKFAIVVGLVKNDYWVGQVDDDPWDRTEYYFNCVDSFRSIHKVTPNKFISETYLESKIPNESKGQVLPRVWGYVQDAKLFTISKEDTAPFNVLRFGTESKGNVSGFWGFPNSVEYPFKPDGNFSKICLNRGSTSPELDWQNTILTVVAGGGVEESFRVVGFDSTKPFGKGYSYDILTLDRPINFEDEGVLITGNDRGFWDETVTNYVANDIVEHFGFSWITFTSTTNEPAKSSDWQFNTKINSEFNYLNSNLALGTKGFNLVDVSKTDYVPSDFLEYNENEPIVPSQFKATRYESALLVSDGSVERFSRKLTNSENPFKLTKDGVTSYIHTSGHEYLAGNFFNRDLSGIYMKQSSLLPDNKIKVFGELWKARSKDISLLMRSRLKDLVYLPTGFRYWNKGDYYDFNFSNLSPALRDLAVDDDFTTSAGLNLPITLGMGTGPSATVETNLCTHPRGPVSGDLTQDLYEQHNVLSIDFKVEDFNFDFGQFSNMQPCIEFDLVIDSYQDVGIVEDHIRFLDIGTEIHTKEGQATTEGSGSTDLFSFSRNTTGGTLATPARTTVRFTTFPESARPQGSPNAINISSIFNNEFNRLKTIFQSENVKDWVDRITLNLQSTISGNDEVGGGESRFGFTIVEASVLGERTLSFEGASCGVNGPLIADYGARANEFSDVVYDIMRTYDEIPQSEIDVNSFTESSIDRFINGYPVVPARQITENKQSLDYIIELLRQGMFMLVPDNQGRRKIISWMDKNTPIATHSTLGDSVIAGARSILEDSLSDVDRVATTKVYSYASLKYHFNNVTGKFEGSVNVLNTDKDEFPNITDYETEITSDSIEIMFSDFGENWKFDGKENRFAVTIKYDLTLGGTFAASKGDRIRVTNVDGSTAEYIVLTSKQRTQAVFKDSLFAYSVNEFDPIVPSDGFKELGASFLILRGGRKWKNFVTGVEDENYSLAKDVWTNFRFAYQRIKGFNPLPTSLSECKWISKQRTDKSDSIDALNYLYVISKWVTFPKKIVKYHVPIEENLDLDVGSAINFVDPQYTQNTKQLGWIVTHSINPIKNRFELSVILDKDNFDEFEEDNIIDEGIDFNGSLIGNTFDDIDEEGATDDIDEGVV